MPDGKPNLSAPAPKLPDGKPDLSGTWESETGYFQDLAKDLKPGEVAMQPWAKALQADREGHLHTDDLLVNCMPPGVPRINMTAGNGMTHPFKIVQTPALVVLLYETSANSTFRQVFLDGRPLPKDPQPAWLGYSIGRWEGNTLVVDTTNFTDLTAFRGSSEKLHLVERFTRAAPDMLIYQFTVEDPATWDKPWTAEVPWSKAQGPVYEWACHEGNTMISTILNGARVSEREAAQKAGK
jgi:hypothetical protein